jgi:hypothetical protein
MQAEKLRLINALKDLDILMSCNLWKNPTMKSSTESRKVRQEGNLLYAKNHHDEKVHKEILRLYTKSIAYAPPGTEDLGLAYGNRSALLVHFGRHREALKDLDMALNLPLPEINLAKYLCRKVFVENFQFRTFCRNVPLLHSVSVF